MIPNLQSKKKIHAIWFPLGLIMLASPFLVYSGIQSFSTITSVGGKLIAWFFLFAGMC